LTAGTTVGEWERLGQFWIAGRISEWVIFRNDTFSSLDEIAKLSALCLWLSLQNGEPHESIFDRVWGQTQHLLEKHNRTLWAIYHALLALKAINGQQLQVMLRHIRL
jgi:hypothetical protein